MKKADELAFPFEGGANNGIQPGTGLTKREHYAGLAMQGLVSNPNFRGSFKDVSKDAVGMADALLAALEEQ